MLAFKTEEQLEAAVKAKTPEEVLAVAKSAGFEATLEEAEQFLLGDVAGGAQQHRQPRRCPVCSGTAIDQVTDPRFATGYVGVWRCRVNGCGIIWITG